MFLDIAFWKTFIFVDEINNKIHQNGYLTNICSEITERVIFLKVEFAVLEKAWGTILW